jgi:hypothetical protein
MLKFSSDRARLRSPEFVALDLDFAQAIGFNANGSHGQFW